MEDFSFRPSYDVDKASNAFLTSALSYLDSLDHTKASFKVENHPTSLQLHPEFRRHRLNSYEAPVFNPFKEEDHFGPLNDHFKVEAFGQEYPNFAHHGQADIGFDFSAKLQDFAVDYYRINRSRGPSFNLGPARKNSEDLFAHGFDLLNYRNKNFEQQNEKVFPHEIHDPRMHPGFLDDFRTAPLISHVLPGNFGSLMENNYQQNLQMSLENALSKDLTANLMSQIAHDTQGGSVEAPKMSETHSEFDLKGKKKRKTNTQQGVVTYRGEEDEKEETEAVPLQKSKSENKKGTKGGKPSKNIITNPAIKKIPEPKQPKGKKGKQALEYSQVKAEMEDRGDREEKSTQASSMNVSPVPKKEDLAGLLNKSKSSIVGTFGHFKKPETAQELLGGLALPAEVEEYINKSRIFNQIKAPVVRKIGTLTLEERRVKIEKYLEKRKRRSWNKRVNYDCRKKVADNRLRIKGRFVTKDQAFGMLEALGIFPDPEKITNNEIKELLTERFGSILKKKEILGEVSNEKKEGKTGNNMKSDDMGKQGHSDGEQETSSFGSHDDSLSETYLRD